MQDQIQIKKLTVKDYLKIEFYTIDDVGDLVLITGDNEVGKTSFLKAINEVCNPTATAKLPFMIHNNKEKSEIFIEFTNGVTAERTMTPTTNKLKVIDNGSPVSKPKDFLSSMIGYHPFNPIDFFGADKKKRRQILLEASPFELNNESLLEILRLTLLENPDIKSDPGYAVPVKLEDLNFDQHGLLVLEDLKKEVYGIRKTQNEHVVRLQRSIELEKREIPDTFDVEKFKDFNFEEKTKELQKANDTITLLKSIEAKKEAAVITHKESAQRIEQLETQLTRIKEDQRMREEIIHKYSKDLLAIEHPDTNSIQAELNEFNSSQKTILKLEGIEQHEKDYQQEKDYHTSLDDFYKLLANDVPKHVLKTMPMPIAGLEFKEDNIFINGIDLDNLSTKQQIDLSVQIAMSLTNAGFICVDRFESFSPENKNIFIDACKDKGFQLFVTTVSSGPLQVSKSVDEAIDKADPDFEVQE